MVADVRPDTGGARNEEQERLEDVYARYARQAGKHDLSNPGNRAILAEYERIARRLLADEGMLPLGRRTVLDVGCGYGYHLARVCDAYGADPAGCYGIDILASRIEQARRLHPELSLDCGDARTLRFEDDTFDLVLLNVVFSTILDDAVALEVARELRRVLRPEGAILWWDLRYRNPRNPDVRPYGIPALRRIFPGFTIRARAATVVPQLVRRLDGAAGALYPVLAAVPPLLVRYVALLRPPG